MTPLPGTPDAPKLFVEDLQYFRMSWITYSWLLKSGQCGLDRFLQNEYELPSKPDLLESPNDIDYTFDNVGKYGTDRMKQDELEEAGDVIAQLKKTCGVEHYYLGLVLADLVNRGSLPAGNYIISVSW